VDLKRNFRPAEFFNLEHDTYTKSDAFPGANILSESDPKGIFEFLKVIPNLAGAMEMHCYSSLVLRPFGNQANEAPEPWGTKLRNLGNAVSDSIQQASETFYRS
jgi:hypothetical protein